MAFVSFEKVLSYMQERDTKSIPALLGKAALFFRQKEFKKSLKIYKEVIRINPGCPASVRLGIAHCYFHLAKYDLATKVFFLLFNESRLLKEL